MLIKKNSVFDKVLLKSPMKIVLQCPNIRTYHNLSL